MTGWLASVKLAWRDLRAQGRRSVFFALLVAAGVASLVGVQGLARTMESTAHTDARRVMQGDLVITREKDLLPEQEAALERLRTKGANTTEVIALQNVAINTSNKAQTMVDIKVVEPKLWPFYGGFASRSGKPLSETLTAPGDAVVGKELLDRLKLNVGDSFQMGPNTYRITDVTTAEPRNFGGALQIGPRIFLSPEGAKPFLEGLDQRTILVKVPEGGDLAEAKASLQTAFKGERTVQTYDEAWKDFASVMDHVFTFLSMVALISLLVGGLGVAMAMRTFISQKLEHIAVLKALGATSGRIALIFLVQAGILGLSGSLLGVGLGLGVQQLLPQLLRDVIPVEAGSFNWNAAVGGLVAGTATAMICALLPVRGVRNIKPGALFRSEAGGAPSGWKGWLETGLISLAVIGGLGWVAATYAKSTTVGFGFLGALLLAALGLFLAGTVLLIVTRLLPQAGLPAFRHALRSLNAPGSQATSVIVAMGVGIMLITTVYLFQNSLIGELRQVGASPDTPNLYVMGVSPDKRNEVRSYLESHAGVAKVPDPIVLTSATVVAVDGQSAADRELPSYMKSAFPLTSHAKDLPMGTKVVDGEWFTPDDLGKPLLAVDQTVAQQMSIRAGSTMVLRIKNDEVTFTVKALLGASGAGVRVNNAMIGAAPGAIDKWADSYMLLAITRPGQEGTVVSDMLTRFPGTMPVGLSDLMAVLDSYINKVGNILRFVTGFAVVAAGVILSGSLSATRFRRRKEAALLKTLGASRFTVALASALENGVLGAVAGIAGAGLAYGLIAGSAALLSTPVATTYWPLAGAALGGAAMAILVGIASTLDVLNVRPLQVLRSE